MPQSAAVCPSRMPVFAASPVARTSRTRSRVEKAEKGYKLICSIEDSEKTLLHVEVFLTDANYAEKLRINYDERAEIIYKGVLSLLSGEVNFLFDE